MVGWMRERMTGLSAAVNFSFFISRSRFWQCFQAAFEEARFDVAQNHV